MRAFWFSVLAFVLGLIGGFVAAIAIYVIATEIGGVRDRDGGGAMATFFILGPMLGLVVGLVSAVTTGIVTARRARQRAEGTRAPLSRWSPGLHMALSAVLTGLLFYVIAQFTLWIVGRYTFSTYWLALAVAQSPIIAGLAGAAFGGWLALDKRAAPQAVAADGPQADLPAAYAGFAGASPTSGIPAETSGSAGSGRHIVVILAGAFLGFCGGYLAGIAILLVAVQIFGATLPLLKIASLLPTGLGLIGLAIGGTVGWRRGRGGR